MAQAPRPGVGRRAAAEDAHITFKLGDEPYTLFLTEVKPIDVAAYRKATGLSWQWTVNQCGVDMDIDLLAGVVWMIRYKRGDEVTYEEVATSFDYTTSFGFSDEPAEEDKESPEA